ncbi:hypothetical protein DSECCO2_484870 [anaerobic digester metagenome]
MKDVLEFIGGGNAVLQAQAQLVGVVEFNGLIGLAFLQGEAEQFQESAFVEGIQFEDAAADHGFAVVVGHRADALHQAVDIVVAAGFLMLQDPVAQPGFFLGQARLEEVLMIEVREGRQAFAGPAQGVKIRQDMEVRLQAEEVLAHGLHQGLAGGFFDDVDGIAQIPARRFLIHIAPENFAQLSARHGLLHPEQIENPFRLAVGQIQRFLIQFDGGESKIVDFQKIHGKLLSAGRVVRSKYRSGRAGRLH